MAADIVDHLAQNMIADIKAKIEAGEINGNTDKMLLYLLADTHTRVQENSENPMMVLGRLMKQYPALAWPVLIVAWVLAGGTAALLAIEFITALGLKITRVH
jgi:hypothetical protein